MIGKEGAAHRINAPAVALHSRMTVAQWNTAAFGPDYRLAPLQARNETFTWTLPEGIATGEVTVAPEVLDHLAHQRAAWVPVTPLLETIVRSRSPNSAPDSLL